MLDVRHRRHLVNREKLTSSVTIMLEHARIFNAQ